MKSFKAHLDEACWKGYKAIGVKDKGGKKVPNCVPEEVKESVDKKDTITVDIPLMIRLLELAREDVKTDVELHQIVERLISIRNKGVLTMNDYKRIAKK